MPTTLTVKALKGYIGAGFNVIISGVHGVGKTAKLQDACNQLGLKMKYYSASTLDPYTDLTGVPVPNQATKTVEYFRPREIDEAEVIFFDEINRADPKTLNAVFEIIQFQSINGEKLPKLKCVIAAMNPVSEEYTTDELDAALMDRFDVFLKAEPEIEVGYFIQKFGDRLGGAAVKVWQEYEKSRTDKRSASANDMAYLSPRRMDKITAAFQAIPSRQTVLDTLPPEVMDASLSGRIYRALNEAIKPPQVEESDLSAKVTAIVMASISQQQKPETGKVVTEILAASNLETGDKDRLLNSLAASLNDARVTVIVGHFSEAVRAMKAPQRSILTSGWPATKLEDMRKRMSLGD